MFAQLRSSQVCILNDFKKSYTEITSRAHGSVSISSQLQKCTVALAFSKPLSVWHKKNVFQFNIESFNPRLTIFLRDTVFPQDDRSQGT